MFFTQHINILDTSLHRSCMILVCIMQCLKTAPTTRLEDSFITVLY
jgi:hypothetical protein